MTSPSATCAGGALLSNHQHKYCTGTSATYTMWLLSVAVVVASFMRRWSHIHPQPFHCLLNAHANPHFLAPSTNFFTTDSRLPQDPVCNAMSVHLSFFTAFVLVGLRSALTCCNFQLFRLVLPSFTAASPSLATLLIQFFLAPSGAHFSSH